MNDEVKNLSGLQIDALKEIGNVGAGNAATSLAILINRRVEMSVPRVSIIPLTEMWNVTGTAEDVVCGIFLRVFGTAPASILFLMPIENALQMVDMLTGQPAGTTSKLGDIGVSALKELGNILTGTYLNALSMFTGLEFSPSVPSLATDMSASILGSLISPMAEVGDYALMIETVFSEDHQSIVGHFMLLPDPGSLGIILEKLGVNR